MRRSLILDTTVRLIFDGAMVLSVYLLFAGHNQPGGGFVGGLVAAAAIALRYLAGDPDVRSTVRMQPWTLLSVGLVLATATAMVPLAFGRPPLDHDAVEWQLELLGKLKVTSATVFDTGVYLIVVGLVLMIFEGLGDDAADGAADEQRSDGDA